MSTFNQFFVAGLLVFSASSLWAADPCKAIRTSHQCKSYPTGECFWDAEDQMCIRICIGEDPCLAFLSRSLCQESHFECFWDLEDERCSSIR